MRLVLDSHKMSRFTHPSPKLLKVNIESLTGFIHVYHPDGLNNTILSQGYISEAASSVGKASRTHIPRTGKSVRIR